MRRTFPLLALLAACAGGAQPVYLKPGAPAFAAEQDFLACAADAQRDFPVTSSIRTAPRITLGTGLCRSNFCGGINTGPDIYDVDRNEGLRDRAVDACMVGKGYRETALPACTGAVTVLQSQPFDSRGLCVTRDGRIAAR